MGEYSSLNTLSSDCQENQPKSYRKKLIYRIGINLLIIFLSFFVVKLTIFFRIHGYTNINSSCYEGFIGFPFAIETYNVQLKPGTITCMAEYGNLFRQSKVYMIGWPINLLFWFTILKIAYKQYVTHKSFINLSHKRIFFLILFTQICLIVLSLLFRIINSFFYLSYIPFFHYLDLTNFFMGILQLTLLIGGINAIIFTLLKSMSFIKKAFLIIYGLIYIALFIFSMGYLYI